MRSFIAFFYKYVSKPILFRFDPELVHDHFIWMGEFFGKFGFVKALLGKVFVYKNPALEQDVLGIHFMNPVGIAGGFDKDARLTQVLPSVGLGYHEVGSITAKPYGGNPKPRLKRFPKTQSIWVNYGLKNKGAKVLYEKLKSMKFAFPIFFNIAKTNCKETVDCKVAIEDYLESVSTFRDIASIFTINISCPNAHGGQPFHKPEDLEMLLSDLDDLIDREGIDKPMLLKISPELSDSALDGILKVCDQHKVDGIIISNLRKKKVEEDFDTSERGQVAEHGGLSGKYLESHADRMLKYVATKVKKGECNKYVLVGLGGVFNAEDAYRKIRSGASLVQLITGMIFEGPQVIAQINEGLVKLLKRDGFENISEAVGVDI